MAQEHSKRLPERDSDGKLPAYAWPGGHTIIYLDGDNSILCADCATRMEDDPDEAGRRKPHAFEVYYEGTDEYCADCNAVLPSAYGDPEDDEQEEQSTEE